MSSRRVSASALSLKVLLLLLWAGLVYASEPVFAWDYVDSWFMGGLLLLILAAVPWTRTGDYGKRMTTAGLYSLAAFTVFVGVAMVSSGSLFRASAYHDLLGPVETMGKFADALPPVDLQSAPLVDESMARRVAEKRLSDVPGMGSSYRVGAMVKQRIGSKLFWVGFLQYNSFFVQLNQGFTPGYVRVSATDPSNVELVTSLGNEKLQLRYVASAMFAKNVERYAYLNGYMSQGIEHFVPHLDEAGRPMYIATLYRHAVGFAGADATGVVSIDAQTGDIKEYSLTNAPAWIDRIQTEDMLEEQITDNGYYVPGHAFGGWLNPSNEGRQKPSGGLVFADAKTSSEWYTGVSNFLASDTSISGFMLIDARTKKVRLYQLAGVSEDAAAKAALGSIPEKRYQATYPLPFSLDGVPTYIMTLKDATGIARAYAMVSIANYQAWAVGDTLTSTLRAYQGKLASDSSKTSANQGPAKAVKIDSSVWRIAADTHGGSTMYYVALETDDKHLFVGSIDLNEKIALTRTGDHVVLTYADGDARVLNMQSFDNLSIGQGRKAQ